MIFRWNENEARLTGVEFSNKIIRMNRIEFALFHAISVIGLSTWLLQPFPWGLVHFFLPTMVS
jgi:hypothetical protein